jgi:F1F0 ATPase subunit 2
MIAILIGIVLGIIYFGGLYLSVQKINEVKYPSLLMTLSFVIRMGILVGAFFYLSKSGYKNILFALLGVMAVRLVMTFTIKNQTPNSIKRSD